jgi:tartrate dehydratase alpha subunit/fumarate hydratase class I-like protein
MDLQTRKIEFIHEFLKVQRKDIVDRLEKLLKKETSKIESEKLDSFTTEELQSRINR